MTSKRGEHSEQVPSTNKHQAPTTKYQLPSTKHLQVGKGLPLPVNWRLPPRHQTAELFAPLYTLGMVECASFTLEIQASSSSSDRRREFWTPGLVVRGGCLSSHPSHTFRVIDLPALISHLTWSYISGRALRSGPGRQGRGIIVRFSARFQTSPSVSRVCSHHDIQTLPKYLNIHTSQVGVV